MYGFRVCVLIKICVYVSIYICVHGWSTLLPSGASLSASFDCQGAIRINMHHAHFPNYTEVRTDSGG